MPGERTTAVVLALPLSGSHEPRLSAQICCSQPANQQVTALQLVQSRSGDKSRAAARIRQVHPRNGGRGPEPDLGCDAPRPFMTGALADADSGAPERLRTRGGRTALPAHGATAWACSMRAGYVCGWRSATSPMLACALLLTRKCSGHSESACTAAVARSSSLPCGVAEVCPACELQ